MKYAIVVITSITCTVFLRHCETEPLLHFLLRGDTPGEHSALQIIVKMRADAWNDPPEVCRVTPDEVPVVALKDSGAVVRVLVGECHGSVSPAKVSGLPSIAILHVIAPPAAAKPISLPIDGRYERGWMYV